MGVSLVVGSESPMYKQQWQTLVVSFRLRSRSEKALEELRSPSVTFAGRSESAHESAAERATGCQAMLDEEVHSMRNI